MHLARLIFILTGKSPATKLCSFVTPNKKQFREQMKLLYELQREDGKVQDAKDIPLFDEDAVKESRAGKAG